MEKVAQNSIQRFQNQKKSEFSKLFSNCLGQWFVSTNRDSRNGIDYPRKQTKHCSRGQFVFPKGFNLFTCFISCRIPVSYHTDWRQWLFGNINSWITSTSKLKLPKLRTWFHAEWSVYLLTQVCGFFIALIKNKCFSLYVLFWDTIRLPTLWRGDYESQ